MCLLSRRGAKTSIGSFFGEGQGSPPWLQEPPERSIMTIVISGI